jgi:chorismate mutase/prephenate dehydrogenase
MDENNVEERRAELADLDRKILELVARRQAQVTEIGRIKSRAGRPTRDFGQEKNVVERARGLAAELGMSEDLAEALVLMLIRSSLTVQEQDRVQASGRGGGRRVLIIGGAGKMGRWFARFLGSQGFDVEIADPREAVDGLGHLLDWQDSTLDHDFIIVAAPLRRSNEILGELANRKPGGIIFDVGSLKTPLRAGLKALMEADVRVTSIHPMFGPDTELLSGRHVIFVDVGVPAATKAAKELFAETMAIQVEMDLDSHDRLIAYILGLSHALNIAFFTTLAESGEAAPELVKLSSTTFDSQLEVARAVAGENPHLYFEIQSLNDHGHEILTSLQASIERIRVAVQAGDEASFAALMESGREYLREIRSPT